jgi:CRISPR-associated endonuclease/helicase Cas3
MHYAHTLKDRPQEDWEPLERHLQEVAKLAGEFADAFGAKEWGHLAGLWHDLGKYSSGRLLANLGTGTSQF